MCGTHCSQMTSSSTSNGVQGYSCEYNWFVDECFSSIHQAQNTFAHPPWTFSHVLLVQKRLLLTENEFAFSISPFCCSVRPVRKSMHVFTRQTRRVVKVNRWIDKKLMCFPKMRGTHEYVLIIHVVQVQLKSQPMD